MDVGDLTSMPLRWFTSDQRTSDTVVVITRTRATRRYFVFCVFGMDFVHAIVNCEDAHKLNYSTVLELGLLPTTAGKA